MRLDFFSFYFIHRFVLLTDKSQNPNHTPHGKKLKIKTRYAEHGEVCGRVLGRSILCCLHTRGAACSASHSQDAMVARVAIEDVHRAHGCTRPVDASVPVCAVRALSPAAIGYV